MNHPVPQGEMNYANNFFKLTQFFNEQKVILQHVRDESAGGGLNAHHALMLGTFQLELSQPLGLRH